MRRGADPGGRAQLHRDRPHFGLHLHPLLLAPLQEGHQDDPQRVRHLGEDAVTQGPRGGYVIKMFMDAVHPSIDFFNEQR